MNPEEHYDEADNSHVILGLDVPADDNHDFMSMEQLRPNFQNHPLPHEETLITSPTSEFDNRNGLISPVSTNANGVTFENIVQDNEQVEKSAITTHGGIKPSASLDTVSKLHPDSPLSDTAIDAHEAAEIRELKRAVKHLPTWQRRLYNFFEVPDSIWGKLFGIISFVFVLIYVVVTVLQTLPLYTNESGESSLRDTLFPLEVIINVWWSVEIIGRFVAAPIKWKFIANVLNIIDAISILPFWISVCLPSDSTDQAAKEVVRIFGFLRIFKLLRLVRYNTGLRITFKALQKSLEAVWLLMLYVVLILVMSSAAMFYAERGTWNNDKRQWLNENGETSSYQSMLDGFYWSITTLTTVGYGDLTPITSSGRLIAGFTMVLSIMVIALPTSIIGSNFMSGRHTRDISCKLKLPQVKIANFKVYSKKNQNKKIDQLQFLTDQNNSILQVIGEIQEKLNDVNPPRHYQKAKDLEVAYAIAKQRIHELEEEVEKWKQIARHDDNSLSPSKYKWSYAIKKSTEKINSFKHEFTSRPTPQTTDDKEQVASISNLHRGEDILSGERKEVVVINMEPTNKGNQ